MATMSDREDTGIRRRWDGSIDTDFYARRAMTLRATAFGERRTELARRFARLIAVVLQRRGQPRPGFRR